MADQPGAPLGPEDVPNPIPNADPAAVEKPEFTTGTKVEGVQRAIGRRGVFAIAAVLFVFLIAVADGLNLIHIDFGLGKLITHEGGAMARMPSPTPPPVIQSASNADGALADLVDATPLPPKPSPSPTPLGRVTAAPVGYPPPAPPPSNPYPTTNGRVPNLDASGPSVAYRPGPYSYPSAYGPNGAGNDAAAKAAADERARIEAAKNSEMSPGVAPAGADQSPIIAQAAAANSGGGTVAQRSAAEFGHVQAGGYLEADRQAAISKYEIWPGRYLRMLLDTAIIVDLPGQVCGHLLEPARDSLTATVVLMPERTELCGFYNTIVGNGASRIQIAWRQATFPDGSTLQLAGMGSSDRNGWSGLGADVNNHMGAVIGSALLTSIVAAVVAATNPSTESITGYHQQTPGQAAGESILQTGSQITNQKVNLPPTLSLKKSTEVNLTVDRAIILPPYQAIPANDQ
jgi:type IV secretory pathway VirB10-like protein